MTWSVAKGKLGVPSGSYNVFGHPPPHYRWKLRSLRRLSSASSCMGRRHGSSVRKWWSPSTRSRLPALESCWTFPMKTELPTALCTPGPACILCRIPFKNGSSNSSDTVFAAPQTTLYQHMAFTAPLMENPVEATPQHFTTNMSPKFCTQPSLSPLKKLEDPPVTDLDGGATLKPLAVDNLQDDDAIDRRESLFYTVLKLHVLFLLVVLGYVILTWSIVYLQVG